MKRIKLLVFLPVISVLLVGYVIYSGHKEQYSLQGSDKGTYAPLLQPEDRSFESNSQQTPEDVIKLTLAKSQGHGSMNPNILMEYEDNTTIEIFVRAVHNAVQLPGILNTGVPNYDIVLASDSKKFAYHLWINETSEQAMLMDVKDTHVGYQLTKESTAEIRGVIFQEINFEELKFKTERNADGDLVAKPLGISEANYMISGGPVVKLHGISYHTIHFFYGDHNAINALVAQDPSNDEVLVKWTSELKSSDNLWNNAFMSSYNLLIPLDDDHLLFLEPELTSEAGQYHLSSYNVITGTIERLREDFWPLTDEYDYIYKTEWNDDRKQLFMQSYLGNVWIFDLKTGKDHVHDLQYPVIPHSTTGAPSLFLSPTFERFVHDDESGQLTFFNQKGDRINTISLPSERYVPSEKIKWNPAGTIAWMDLAEEDRNRILDIDIDYLRIAPQEIHFYNENGLLIGSLQAEDRNEGAAVEVAGWIDANIAVIKSYTVELKDNNDIGLNIKGVSYFLYDVNKKKKGSSNTTIPPATILTTDRQEGSDEDEGNVVVDYKEITYLKAPNKTVR